MQSSAVQGPHTASQTVAVYNLYPELVYLMLRLSLVLLLWAPAVVCKTTIGSQRCHPLQTIVQIRQYQVCSVVRETLTLVPLSP